jgi:DnaJ-domain-containing protein 1
MAVRDMETVLREIDHQNRLAYERMEGYKFGELAQHCILLCSF